MAFFILVPLCLLPLVVPTWMWFRRAPDASRNWVPQQIGTRRLDAGSYRETEVPVFGQAGPPWEVRLAALGSWVLGTMFVPGLLLGLVGLFAAGVGLISVPGLILAARLFRLGTPLLRGEPDAAPQARSAARYAMVLNIVVLVGCLVTALLSLRFLSGSLRSDLGALFAAVMVAVYALLSIGHARLLHKAADAIDAKWTAELTEQLRSGVRVDATGAPAAMPTDAQLDALFDDTFGEKARRKRES